MAGATSSLVSIATPKSSKRGLNIRATAITFGIFWVFLFVANFIVAVPGHVSADNGDSAWKAPMAITIAAVGKTTIELLIAYLFALILWRLTPDLRPLLGFLTFQAVDAEAEIDQQISSILKRRAPLSAAEIGYIDRLLVMDAIDDRVRRLSDRANLILGSIAIALVVAALVVVFAGRLTGLDASAVSNVDKARRELASTQVRLGKLYKRLDILREINKLDQQTRAPDNTAELSELRKQIEEKTKDLLSYQDFDGPSDPITYGNINAISSMIDSTEAHQKILTDLLGQIYKSEFLAEHGYSDWRYIVATAITRVGVVLIIVFLVQILMGLYRYNTRLITHYNSRRDLLTLWEGDQRKLKGLYDVMSPPTFDFGKDPKHPLQDIIRAIGSQMSKASGDKPQARKEAKAKDKDE